MWTVDGLIGVRRRRHRTDGQSRRRRQPFRGRARTRWRRMASVWWRHGGRPHRNDGLSRICRPETPTGPCSRWIMGTLADTSWARSFASIERDIGSNRAVALQRARRQTLAAIGRRDNVCLDRGSIDAPAGSSAPRDRARRGHLFVDPERRQSLPSRCRICSARRCVRATARRRRIGLKTLLPRSGWGHGES